MNENTKELQLSFLPQGWVNIDVTGNRLSLFMRNYPFEGKFADIRTTFEELRYKERKEEAAVRKIKRTRETEHFEFCEDVELVNELHIGGRESAAGRKGFEFFGLLKLFLACMLKNTVQVTAVYQELLDNPVLQLECFDDGRLPSYDVLAAFDRDMNRYGLMAEVRRIAVDTNFSQGINHVDGRIIIDVTHSEGNGKIGKMAKRCRDCHGIEADTSCERCLDGKPCDTPNLTDETIDIVHKNKGKVLKSHKYQLGSTATELPIGVVAFNGSKSDGGPSFEVILHQIKSDCSAWLGDETSPLSIYADGIYHNVANCEMVKRVFGPNSHLKSKPNPGNRKPHKIARNGIEFTINKRANVTCEKGGKFKFDAREVGKNRYRFIIEDETICTACPLSTSCCPNADHGKTLRFPKDLLPHFNWDNPEFTTSYEQSYAVRTGIERIIGRGKDLLGFRRQFKRGLDNVQGFGDRLVAMVNMIAYVAHAIGHPERMLQCRNFAVG
jgi:hypothetical protein